MKIVSLHHASLLSPPSPYSDRLSSGLSLGLFVLTLPTVGYALVQLWRLMSGGNLEQAIRAFAA